MDPYVKVKIGDQVEKTLSDKHGHLEPSWDESLKFELNGPASIEIQVKNECMLFDDVVAKTTISLTDWLSLDNLSASENVKLMWAGKEAGTLLLEMYFEPNEGVSRKLPEKEEARPQMLQEPMKDEAVGVRDQLRTEFPFQRESETVRGNYPLDKNSNIMPEVPTNLTEKIQQEVQQVNVNQEEPIQHARLIRNAEREVRFEKPEIMITRQLEQQQGPSFSEDYVGVSRPYEGGNIPSGRSGLPENRDPIWP